MDIISNVLTVRMFAQAWVGHGGLGATKFIFMMKLKGKLLMFYSIQMFAMISGPLVLYAIDFCFRGVFLSISHCPVKWTRISNKFIK